MIEKIADMIIDKQLEEHIISKEDVNIYKYGYTLIYEILINIIVSGFIGIISGEWLTVIVFLIIYIPLRSFCGGWHADKFWKCTIYSNFIIVLIIISKDYAIEVFKGIGLFVLFMMCLMLILYWAPMDTKSKPISIEEQKVYKKKIKAIVMVQSLISIFTVLKKENTVLYVITFAYVTQVVMLFIEIMSRKVRKRRE